MADFLVHTQLGTVGDPVPSSLLGGMAPEVLCIAVLDSDASQVAVQQLVAKLLARPRGRFVELHLLHVSFLGVSGAHLRSQVDTPQPPGLDFCY